MNINLSNTLNFGSIKNPVKPFEINTPQGKLYVSEVTKNTPFYELTSNMANKFANKNISKTKLGASLISLLGKGQMAKKLNSNDDTTLLVARNDDNKICGTIFAYADENSKNMLEFYDIAVDKKYRGNSVSTKMFNAISKDGYDELFLQAKNSAIPVYKKWGFEELKPKNKTEEIILKTMAIFCSVASCTLMHKSLKAGSKNWLQYVVKN